MPSWCAEHVRSMIDEDRMHPGIKEKSWNFSRSFRRRSYASKLLPVDLEAATGHFEIEDRECANGVCPVK